MNVEPEQASTAKGHTYARPRKKVMISSTARDLPEHRQQVIEACLRMDCTPLPMETLTAADATAVEESLRLVDEADLYVGIFAHRYGFVPPGYDVSITELEYNRACERQIPRLVFVMHDEHPLKASDVETGPGADKLKRLKDRIGVERVAAFFKSPADLACPRHPDAEPLPRKRRAYVPLCQRYPRAARSVRRPSVHAAADPRPDRTAAGTELADRLGRRAQ